MRQIERKREAVPALRHNRILARIGRISLYEWGMCLLLISLFVYEFYIIDGHKSGERKWLILLRLAIIVSIFVYHRHKQKAFKQRQFEKEMGSATTRDQGV